MVIRFGKCHGAHIRFERGAQHTKWLCAVVWYRRSPQRLGYLYLSAPANLAALRLLVWTCRKVAP